MPLLAGRLLSVVFILALAVSGVVFLLSRGSTAPANPTGTAHAGAVRQAPTSHRRSVGRPVGHAAATRQSTARLAGQRIVYAYAGRRPPVALLTAIRKGEAAGVVFFATNVTSTSQLHEVAAELQRAARAAPGHRPLLLLTDQEGGEVRRLPGAPVASEKRIGSSFDAGRLARAAGSGAGATLGAAGLNVNLAPVLDVYRQPGNFIDQYARSYSSHPASAAGLGAAFIGAQQRIGVAATAKHFPGLGAAATAQNTDLRPVTLATPAATLRAVDEAPYRAAIAVGVKLVMVSWARYPAVDPRRPAGLSPLVIGGELRRRLGFRGVTITDGIEAGALRAYGPTATRAVLAAGAGADLILCSSTVPSDNSPAIGFAARDAIAAAIGHRRLSRAGAQAAADRILALRAAL